MNHVHDTWYVLEDGSKADPNDVNADENGTLRRKCGRAVALRGSVPRTSGAGPTSDDEEKHRLADEAADKAEGTRKVVDAKRELDDKKGREMKASDDGKGYRTRGVKAD